MSKLQELLDERWPISEDTTMADKLTLGSFRMIFTEGYNAAMEEVSPEKENPDHHELLKKCGNLIVQGLSLTALKLYKDKTGCSISQAKAILNL